MNDSQPEPVSSNEKVRRWLSNKRSTWMVAAAALVVVIGLSCQVVTRAHPVPSAQTPDLHRRPEEQPARSARFLNPD